MHALAVSILLSTLFACALAGQHIVPQQTLEVDKLLTQRVGMFALKDTPLGKAHPYVEAIFDFSYVNESSLSPNLTTDVLVEIIFCHHTQLDMIGKLRNNEWVICCDEGSFADGTCTNPDRLVLLNEFGNLNLTEQTLNGSPYFAGHDWFKYNAIFVPRNGSSHFSLRFEPLKTGFWYLFLSNCDYSINANVYFEGSTSWYNPYGWLPAQSYGDMAIYFVLAGFYGIIVLIWIWRLIKFRKDLQLLQHFTTALIVLGLIDMLLWGENYGYYNKHGHFSMTFLGFSIFFLAVQYMWIRLMVLLMAVGYTITRDKLVPIEIGATSFLMVCYMISAGAVQYILLAQLDNDNTLADWAEPLMTFFEIFFNLIIIIWIVTATVRSMRALKAKKQSSPVKATFYTRLLIIFGVITFIIVVLFIADLAIKWADKIDYAMQWQWLFNSIWDWIYFALTCYVAWVWQPDDNNARYAYVPLEEADDNKQTELEPEVAVAPAEKKTDSSSSSSS